MNLDVPAQNQIAMMLFLLAGFNLSLFLFNMLPLLPLDGGHIAGASGNRYAAEAPACCAVRTPAPSTWRN